MICIICYAPSSLSSDESWAIRDSLYFAFTSQVFTTSTIYFSVELGNSALIEV